MGGNALSCGSIRLPKATYLKVADDCVSRLRTLYPGRRVQALGSYRAKADFGDCDILIEGGQHYDPETAAVILGAREVVRNGPVTSIGIKMRHDVDWLAGNVFQVDLICMEAEAFDFAVGYFGHSDAGNLFGRIAHAMGLTLRHDGLYFYFRDGDHKFREILLTRDYGLALQFLGYDLAPFRAGFDTLEDIFRYVASTPYFNRDIFLLENRNARARVRDRKRPTYMEFLRWCETQAELPAFEYPADKAAWHGRIAEYFPHFPVTLESARFDLARLHAVREKFNGELVSQWTGLEGKALGVLMRALKESFQTTDALQAFILQRPLPELEARVREVQLRLDELVST